MIPVRYHVVSLVAVFLALAAGIALGGGPLSELGRAEPAPAPSQRGSAAAAEARSAAGFADAVVASGAARLYGNALESEPVALVVFPGVGDSTVTAVGDQIRAAGGTVTGRYALTAALVNPGEKALVDTLGSQLLTQLREQEAEVELTAEASTYQRAGELIGLAVATKDTGQRWAVGPLATSVLESFAGAELLAGVEAAETRATRVVVLLGPDTAAAEDVIYEGLIAGLAQQAAAVTVAASVDDGADGRLGRLRETAVSASVATVDGVELAAGQVTTVLALSQWPATRGGSYGASGADGAVPLR